MTIKLTGYYLVAIEKEAWTQKKQNLTNREFHLPNKWALQRIDKSLHWHYCFYVLFELYLTSSRGENVYPFQRKYCRSNSVAKKFLWLNWDRTIYLPLFALVNTLQKHPPEVFCKKKVFLEISENSQENTRGRDSFLIKFQTIGLQLY